MEENNFEQTNLEETNLEKDLNPEKKKHVCFQNHCWKKCLAMVCASFLGGFLAFYFVADQMMHRHYRPHHFNHPKFQKGIFDGDKINHRNLYKQLEKIHKKEMDAFKGAFKIDNDIEKHLFDYLDANPYMMDTVKVKSEFDDNKFKIIVSLKPFEGDESKVNYKLVGKKLTVFGASKVKYKDVERDISFSQDFLLPENADTSKIYKEKDDDELEIIVPMK